MHSPESQIDRRPEVQTPGDQSMQARGPGARRARRRREEEEGKSKGPSGRAPGLIGARIGDNPPFLACRRAQWCMDISYVGGFDGAPKVAASGLPRTRYGNQNRFGSTGRGNSTTTSTLQPSTYVVRAWSAGWLETATYSAEIPTTVVCSRDDARMCLSPAWRTGLACRRVFPCLFGRRLSNLIETTAKLESSGSQRRAAAAGVQRHRGISRSSLVC